MIVVQVVLCNTRKQWTWSTSRLKLLELSDCCLRHFESKQPMSQDYRVPSQVSGAHASIVKPFCCWMRCRVTSAKALGSTVWWKWAEHHSVQVHLVKREILVNTMCFWELGWGAKLAVALGVADEGWEWNSYSQNLELNNLLEAYQCMRDSNRLSTGLQS